jgi:hypothetical protein
VAFLNSGVMESYDLDFKATLYGATDSDKRDLGSDVAGDGQHRRWCHPAWGRRGRLLAVVTNGTRALVMMLEEPGDAGEHAIDPTATGHQSEYVLSNGQYDTYDNQDTVPVAQGPW